MNHLKLFESKKIRSVWNEAEQKWYFVVEDVVAVLTDSTDPKQYVKRLRMRDQEQGVGAICTYPFGGDSGWQSTHVLCQCSIAIREELTGEWSNHGVRQQMEYAILTAEISKATFGLTPSEYKKVKGLQRENFRDYMNDLELIFSMLGEASTTEIVKTQHPEGFVENRAAAQEGGKIAGDARKALEKKTEKKIVSKQNYLPPKPPSEPPSSPALT